MTSGELLLCSLLKTGYINFSGQGSGGGYVDFGYDNAAFEYDTKKGVDMSKISQISFKATAQTKNGRVIWKNESTRTNANFSSANNSFSISAPSGDNSHSTLSFYPPYNGSDGGSCVVKVTSFTTTDGKVHTADNLNY